jgi:hypothetical protein
MVEYLWHLTVPLQAWILSSAPTEDVLATAESWIISPIGIMPVGVTKKFCSTTPICISFSFLAFTSHSAIEINNSSRMISFDCDTASLLPSSSSLELRRYTPSLVLRTSTKNGIASRHSYHGAKYAGLPLLLHQSYAMKSGSYPSSLGLWISGTTKEKDFSPVSAVSRCLLPAETHGILWYEVKEVTLCPSQFLWLP